MKMLKMTLMVAVAMAAMLGTEAAPANKMKVLSSESSHLGVLVFAFIMIDLGL